MTVRGTIYVGINLGPDNIADRAAQCALKHIVRLADLDPAPPAKSRRKPVAKA
jgi:hypothetical protein